MSENLKTLDDCIILYNGEPCEFYMYIDDWENAIFPICTHLLTFDDLRDIATELKEIIACDYFDNLDELLNDDSEFDDEEFDSYAEEYWYYYLHEHLMGDYEHLVLSTGKVFYYEDLTDEELESIKGDDVPDSVYETLAEKYGFNTELRNN